MLPPKGDEKERVAIATPLVLVWSPVTICKPLDWLESVELVDKRPDSDADSPDNRAHHKQAYTIWVCALK